MDPFLQLLLVAALLVLLVAAAAAIVAVVLVRRDARRRIQAARVTAMGTAVGRILHQLQNPLQGLLLQSDRLRATGPGARPEMVREAAEAILSESERVSDFLEELRLYASGAARRPERHPMDLGGLAASVARRRAPPGGEGVPVRFMGEEPLPIRGDAYLLDQCIENLVKNAQEAVSEEGGAGEVRVVAERRGAVAAVVVEDDGPGLRGDAAVAIFEPFHTTRAKGMGLGLPICRDIAEAHGGTLVAGNVPGSGARFVLAIPLEGRGPE